MNLDLIGLFDYIDNATGARFLADYSLLALQLAALVFLLLREALRRGDRNIFAILIPLTMIILVQGQAWWMLTRLETIPSMPHLFQYVSRHGARLANEYMALATACLVLGFTVCRRLSRNRPTAPDVKSADPPIPAIEHMRPCYFVVAVWALAASVLSVALTGAVAQGLSAPTAVPGQAGALILLSLGKVPALTFITRGRRPPFPALLLLVFTFVVTLVNSRYLALFILIQCAILFHYCCRPLSRRLLLAGAMVLTVVMVVFGSFRDLVHYLPDQPLDASTIDQYLNQRQSNGIVDYMYELNIEGFAGTAGILTANDGPNGIGHDFGVSSLSFITQIIPAQVRTNTSLPFAGLSEALKSAYPYQNGSIVAPGFELAWAHFSLPGILGLGFLLGFLMWKLDDLLRQHRAQRLVTGTISVHSLELIRGTFAAGILFALADLVMIRIYSLMAIPRARPNRRLASRTRPHRQPSQSRSTHSAASP